MKFDTVWPTDTVEFCPHPAYADLLVCGTYHLEMQDKQSPGNTEQVRKGQCLVLKAEDHEIKQIQAVNLSAVLDLKWCHLSAAHKPLLAAATSEGDIVLLQWDENENDLATQLTVSCGNRKTLCLSLDWSNRRFQHDPASLIVSLSNGMIALLRLDNQGSLQIAKSWVAHDYEPWTVAWDYWNTNVIYSGGDDLKMNAWDIRRNPTSPIFTNTKYDAGITSIQSHFHTEHLLAVGSYDSTVRLYDTRNPSRPLSQTPIGGGAWRVKWHPSISRKHDLLVAGMHDGFKVIHFQDDNLGSQWPNRQEGTISRRFDEHESLAYGVDWSHADARGGETMVASGSFYDHTLHLWSA